MTVTEQAEAIVAAAYATMPCERCGWLPWEHNLRPEYCREVTR